MSTPEFLSENTKLNLNRVPGFIQNWWVISMSITMLIIIGIGWLIPFPEKISGTITFNSVAPDLELVAKATGRLFLNVENHAVAEAGQVVGMIQSDAVLDDILQLESLLNSKEIPIHSDGLSMGEKQQRELALGPLQPDYELLLTYCSQQRFLEERNWLEDRINSLEQQKHNIREKLEALKAQRQITKVSVASSQKNLNIDQELLKEKVIAPYDYNQRLNAHLNTEKELNLITINIAESEEMIKQVELQMLELEAEFDRSVNEINRLINSQMAIVKARLQKWKEQHLLIAPKDGQVIFKSNVENEKYVTEGETCCYILPDQQASESAKMEVPAYQIGEVKSGQKVVVKLDSYPFQKYGVLYGTVGAVGQKQEKNMLPIEVIIDQPLQTSAGKQIGLIEDMTGSAEILIDESNLIQRTLFLLNGLRH